MKRILFFFLICGALICTCNAQDARQVLDRTAKTFTQKGGIKATFTVKSFSGQKQTGQAFSGSILLSGKKFKLNAEGITTWFDGKTQWTFVPANEEVNISEPTEEELQAINPYTFLDIYKKGYSCKFGKTLRYEGKEIHEVVLLATHSKMAIKQIVLYINKANYQLMQIKFRQESSNWTSITVHSFAGGQHYTDATFTFQAKDAPHAELVDLR